ncbi:MAG: glutamate racemase [Firmicutes bacterium]|jgi:glutamate racemase|nr:glutamate racemase [Bacillota bacterium]
MAIGIFDSGVGGLTVWQALQPIATEDIVYFGDTIHIPYGDKTPEQLFGYFRRIMDFFVQRKVSAVVVACNTMSAVVVPRIGPNPPLPLFNMIDAAVAQAVPVTKGRIGVLATRATTESGAYPRALKNAAPDLEVASQACPKLVPFIEAGLLGGPMISDAVKEYVTPLLQAKVDTIILGCTHYPLILPEIRRVAGNGVSILDPAEQIREDVARFLEGRTPTCSPGSCRTEFWVSGDPWRFQSLAQDILGTAIPPVQRYSGAGDGW